MKILSLSILAALVLLFTLTSGITNGSGAPYGRTGSPGDGSNCTHCHSGTPSTDNSFITTDIPASGYVPGQTYTITLSASKAGINKFGFEITAEDASNTKAGSFGIINSTETKMIQDEVTHTGNGTAGSNGQKTWTVQWTAPAAGSGDITFYSAVNAANGNGGTSGDAIILSSHTVTEINVGLSETTASAGFKIFPSTATTAVNLQSPENIRRFQIFNMAGKMVISNELTKPAREIKVNISLLPAGVYLVKIFHNNGRAAGSKFVKR